MFTSNTGSSGAKALAKGRKRGAKAVAVGSSVGIKRLLFAAGPSLDCLPHTVIVRIMSQLCVLDRLRMARVCRRFRELSEDVDIWERNDLSSFDRNLDASMLRLFLRHYCFPSTTSLTLKRSGVRSKGSNRASLLTSSLLDSMFQLHLPNLTDLVLFGVSLKLQKIQDMSALKSLKHLHMENCELQHLFFADINSFTNTDSFTQLSDFCLLGCAMVSLPDLQSIIAFKKHSLRSIKLRYTYRVDPVSAISTIGRCANLREFWLESMPVPLSQDLHCPDLALLPKSLVALSLKGMIKCCTKDGIKQLSAIVPHLRHLDLRDCKDVKDGFEEEAKKAFPELVQLLLK